MYAANHYVRVAGQVYIAGEVLPDLPEDKAAWLLKAGAIREITPAVTPAPPRKEEAPAEPQDRGEEETPEEEIDEEAEPEEIDVMAGIVTESKPSVSKGTASRSGGRKRK